MRPERTRWVKASVPSAWLSVWSWKISKSNESADATFQFLVHFVAVAGGTCVECNLILLYLCPRLLLCA